MDKKTMYYVIAGVVLVLVVGIIIAMQGGNNIPATVDNSPLITKQPVKSESEVNKAIAKELNLSEGELPLRITMDDNGQTASLTPGKNLTVMLGAEYDWTISTSDDKVLAKRNMNLNDARVQAVYQLVGEGKAILSAQGKCKSGSQCVAPTANFVLNVEGVISENVAPADLVK